MTPDEAEAWDRLAFHLENQIGFWFALVVGDDPRPRATLREETRRWCGEHGMTFHVHAPPPELLASLAVELARGAPPGMHWIRADGPDGLIEQWDAATAQLVLAMNERREAYRKRLDGGIILEGRDSLKRLLRELAPDMFSIRAFIAEPEGSVRDRPQSAIEWQNPIRSFVTLTGVASDPDRELQRASRLAGIEAISAKRARMTALYRAAAGLLSVERVEEAERYAEALAAEDEEFRKAHPAVALSPLSLSALNALRGAIASELGKPDQALRYLGESISSLAESSTNTEDHQEHFAFRLAIDVLQTRGNVQLTQGDLAGAEDSFRTRHDFLASVAQASPEVEEFQLDAALAARQLARVRMGRGDRITAEEQMRSVVALVAQKAQENPVEARWRIELLECRRDLGQALMERGDLSGAREEYNAALSVAREFMEIEASDRWLRQLVQIQSLLCSTCLAQRDFDTALSWSERSLGLLEKRQWDRSNAVSLAWSLAFGYAQRAEILVGKEDLAGASVSLLNAWQEAKSLPLPRSEAQMAAAIVARHGMLGQAVFFATTEAHRLRPLGGDNGEAPDLWGAIRQSVGLFKRALLLGTRLLKLNPKDSAVRAMIATVYKHLLLLKSLQGTRRSARRLRRKLRALHRRRPSR